MKKTCPLSVLLTFFFAAQLIGQGTTPVIVSSVQQSSFVDEVESLGTLRANESVTISSTVTELVEKIHFKDGQLVTKGDILVEMDAAEELAQLVEEESRLKQAERQLNRSKELIDSGGISESVLDQAQRDYDAAKARITAIQSRINQRIVRAPFDGLTGLRMISPGALVQPGSVITTIDDSSIMKMDFSVPSVFLSTLKPGIPIQASSRAFAETDVTGTIDSIDSRVDPVTRSVMVRALIPNKSGQLRPGLLMRVSLQKNQREALSIPEGAITLDGSTAYAWRVSQGEGDSLIAEKVTLSLGVRRKGDVEVLGGLAEGDQVITHGGLRLRPNAPISIAAVDDGSLPTDQILRGLGQAKAQ